MLGSMHVCNVELFVPMAVTIDVVNEYVEHLQLCDVKFLCLATMSCNR
jgi:hypothetical protein